MEPAISIPPNVKKYRRKLAQRSECKVHGIKRDIRHAFEPTDLFFPTNAKRT